MAESPFHYRPYLVADDVDPALLRITRVSADERVSRGCRYEIHATCDYGTLEPRGLLRQSVAVIVVRDDGEIVRRMAGVVTRAAERATTVEGRQEIRLVIEDPLSLLRFSSDHRVFQEMTSRDIVELLLKEAGITSFEFRLSSSPPTREVCTQYGETMRSFLDRLLEEDGIAWFVEQAEDGPKIVFGDDPSGWSDTPFDVNVPYAHGAGLHPEEALAALDLVARARPSKVTLRDHDFEKPNLDLESTFSADTALNREHYEYPGRHRTPAGGKARAKAIGDALVAEATAARAHGYIVRLTAGHALELQGTPGGAHDGSWVALEVTQSWEHGGGGEPRLETTARLLRKDQRFAPLPETPRPIARTDLAVVTTPAGEEIHCDKHGRVKVQFLWDRRGKKDDTSSAWIRVGQMHTSGSVAIPRKDWEVVVEYEDGDPDRPIVLGRVYNAAAPPTDSLPGGATNSTLISYTTPGGGGQNEIRMNDGGGGELVQIHAQKDLNLVVGNDKQETVGTTAEIGVVANETIAVGANETTRVGSQDVVTIGGSQTYEVGATRTKTVSADDGTEVAGDRSVTIGASHTVTTPQTIETNTAGSLTETIGGTCLEAAAMGVEMAVAGSLSITVGGAKIETVVAGKEDTNVGAKASTIGGALLATTPKDIEVAASGSKTTTVGGAWMANAGGTAEILSDDAIEITVGGAIAMNAASKIVLKVGGSNVTISAGSVVLESKEVKLTASGPAAELAAMVGSK